MSAINKNVALFLDSKDNVAILLDSVLKGDLIFLKGTEKSVQATQPIETGHKIALTHIEKSAAIIKYGQQIGIATTDIKPGEWIHLHNMESVYDKEFKKRIEV
ncbi:MAG: UxaA family hydrolase [Candidatus Latescibacteria bacterium]|nr:UxaA family hydrolase [Candidatus Latescibacterota bacterium]